MSYDYELLVIGSGPAGQKAAIQAAKLGRHVAVVECREIGGVSRYRELARGQILGDTYGMLKLLVSTADRTVLGVHVLGTNATEVIHIGQAVMGPGGTVDYLVNSVFNYPTLAESYKVAALDAKSMLRASSAWCASGA